MVAAQRGVRLSLLELQPHERAVDDFLRRIERQEAAGRLRRALPPSGVDLRAQQLSEDRKGDAPVADALVGDPFVEAAKAGRESLQEIGAIELRRLADALDRAGQRQPFETAGVDLHEVGIEADRLAFAEEEVGTEAERVAQVGDQQPEAALGVDAEDHRCKEAQRLGAAQMQSQPDHQRFGRAAADRKRIPFAIDGRKVAEETNLQERHGPAVRLPQYVRRGSE